MTLLDCTLFVIAFLIAWTGKVPLALLLVIVFFVMALVRWAKGERFR